MPPGFRRRLEHRAFITQIVELTKIVEEDATQRLAINKTIKLFVLAKIPKHPITNAALRHLATLFLHRLDQNPKVTIPGG